MLFDLDSQSLQVCGRAPDVTTVQSSGRGRGAGVAGTGTPRSGVGGARGSMGSVKVDSPVIVFTWRLSPPPAEALAK